MGQNRRRDEEERAPKLDVEAGGEGEQVGALMR